MKILILTNLYPPQVVGGYERSIADFARLLQHRGHWVLVLTSDSKEYTTNYTGSRYSEPTVERCFVLGGRWTEQGAEWFSREQTAVGDLRNSKMLCKHLQSFQPDVCLAGNIDCLDVSLLEQILNAQIPVVHYLMNEKPGYYPDETPQSSLYRCVTCSHWLIQVLLEAGYPAETAQTVYPGAAVEDFYQVELPVQDHLRIAYASLVMPYKGVDVLIEALSLLSVVGVRFTATIAGGTFDPNFVEALQHYVTSEGMQEQVRFVGALSRSELSQLYKTHNVLVFPSRFQEPFGISQIEAMAAGLAVITSGTGGAREIIEHGQDGLLFESGNPIALADSLSFLHTHPIEWKTIAHQGQQKALSQFDQTKAAEELEKILYKAIDI